MDEIDDVTPKPLYDHRYAAWNNDCNFETNFFDENSADRNCPSNDLMDQADDWPFLMLGTDPYHQRIYNMMKK